MFQQSGVTGLAAKLLKSVVFFNTISKNRMPRYFKNYSDFQFSSKNFFTNMSSSSKKFLR